MAANAVSLADRLQPPHDLTAGRPVDNGQQIGKVSPSRRTVEKNLAGKTTA
jgi:hypothetical protein